MGGTAAKSRATVHAAVVKERKQTEIGARRLIFYPVWLSAVSPLLYIPPAPPSP